MRASRHDTGRSQDAGVARRDRTSPPRERARADVFEVPVRTGRRAGRDQQAVLARWSGWGSLAPSDWPATSTTRSARSSSSCSGSRRLPGRVPGHPGRVRRQRLGQQDRAVRPGAQHLLWLAPPSRPCPGPLPPHRHLPSCHHHARHPARSAAGYQPTASRHPVAHRDQHIAARWQGWVTAVHRSIRRPSTGPAPRVH